MSRSYKKNPFVKDTNRGMKAYANRGVRRCREVIANGNAYRKITYRYDIYEYRSHETYASYVVRKKWFQSGCGGCRFSNMRQEIGDSMCYWDWYKTYMRK